MSLSSWSLAPILILAGLASGCSTPSGSTSTASGSTTNAPLSVAPAVGPCEKRCAPEPSYYPEPARVRAKDWSTSAGRPVGHEHLKRPEQDGTKQDAAAIAKLFQEACPCSTVIDEATWTYNCFDEAFIGHQVHVGWLKQRGAQYRVVPDDWVAVPANQPKQVGDVALYLDQAAWAHAAVVIAVHEDGRPKRMRSKWSAYSMVEHDPNHVPLQFGEIEAYYRKRTDARAASLTKLASTRAKQLVEDLLRTADDHALALATSTAVLESSLLRDASVAELLTLGLEGREAVSARLTEKAPGWDDEAGETAALLFAFSRLDDGSDLGLVAAHVSALTESETRPILDGLLLNAFDRLQSARLGEQERRQRAVTDAKAFLESTH